MTWIYGGLPPSKAGNQFSMFLLLALILRQRFRPHVRILPRRWSWVFWTGQLVQRHGSPIRLSGFADGGRVLRVCSSVFILERVPDSLCFPPPGSNKHRRPDRFGWDGKSLL